MAAPAIATEKKERTLELLILADKRHVDVLMAKYIAVLMYVEMLVLSVLPLQAISAVFGGVDVGGWDGGAVG